MGKWRTVDLVTEEPMSTPQQVIGSGGPCEATVGDSRAVRGGEWVAVAGAAAFEHGEPFAPGDAVAQTRSILGVIEHALAAAGATMADVIRYRKFMTDIALFPILGAVLSRVFGAIRPAGTMIGNSIIVAPPCLVEIAVDAVVGSGMPAADAPEDEIHLDPSESRDNVHTNARLHRRGVQRITGQRCRSDAGGTPAFPPVGIGARTPRVRADRRRCPAANKRLRGDFQIEADARSLTRD